MAVNRSAEKCGRIVGNLRCALPKGHEGFHDDGEDPQAPIEVGSAEKRVICPSCEGSPVDSEGNICPTCEGECMITELVPSNTMSAVELRDIADCSPERCHDALMWAADEIERLRKLLSTDDTTVSYKCMECGSFHLRVIEAAADRPAVETPDALAKVYDAFGIGSAVRTPQTLLTNIENARRRSACLSAIEREFFTQTVQDDDGEEDEDCTLSWGAEPAEYVDQFRAALAERAALKTSVPAIRENELQVADEKCNSVRPGEGCGCSMPYCLICNPDPRSPVTTEEKS
jgi:hypothetical protein